MTGGEMLSQRGRYGYSLVEMLAVLAVGSVVLAMAGTLAVTLLNVRSARRTEYDHNRALLSLHEQWRTDVRGALQGDVHQPETVVVLSLPSGAIVEYRQDGAALLRTARQDGRLAGRDHYPLPEGTAVHCAWPSQPGEIATLYIEYPLSSVGKRTVQTRPLQGVVGADVRLAPREDATENGG